MIYIIQYIIYYAYHTCRCTLQYLKYMRVLFKKLKWRRKVRKAAREDKYEILLMLFYIYGIINDNIICLVRNDI